MKELQKAVLAALVGGMLGFGIQSVLSIGFRYTRNAEFLAEALGSLQEARTAIRLYHAQKGRWPADSNQLVQAGLLDANNPPIERLRGSARWVGRFDGQGGFLYLSATGQIYLNTDLRREKFTPADWKRLKEADMLLAGTLY